MSDLPAHALLRPRILFPFLLVALIWGSTWFVIVGQISDVSPHWSVAFRFAIAAPAMFVLARFAGGGWRMPRRAHRLAVAMGLFQFCGNYTFVYLAELHLTSGIVALLIGMMLVPNAILGRIWLGQPITPRFIAGSAVALIGIGLLLWNEAIEGSAVSHLEGNVALGAGLALIAMLSASIANVIQAGPAGQGVKLATLLAWAMLYGATMDSGLAFLIDGAPIIPTRTGFWLGTIWLALAGSVVTFPIYYGLVRELGAGRAAYNGVLVVVIAMVISTILENYSWTALSISGAFFAMIGLVIALRARQVKAEN